MTSEKSSQQQRAAYIRHWGAILGRVKAAAARLRRSLTP